MDCRSTRNRPSPPLKSSFIRNIFSILSPYWKSENKVFAYSTVLALFFLSLLAVTTALIINEWYRYFYDSIQANNISAFYKLAFIFLGIVSFSVFRSVLIAYLVSILALKWRKWLTHYYLNKWISSPLASASISSRIDNPDQRIAEDINKFTFETIDLACGLTYTLASVLSFSIVLIGISGNISLWEIVVPHYMFFAALFYAISGTFISQKIGLKLINLSNIQQRSEADLRYCLIRLREKDIIPVPAPDSTSEETRIRKKLNISLANMRRTINVKVRLSLFTETYGQLSLIFSSLLAAPRFFSGAITFGDLMQINSAFGNLCENLSWFINAYHRLADWKATTDRLIGFDKAVTESNFEPTS